MEQKTKKIFLTALTSVIKKDPATSIRKHANELNVHKRTMKTAVKQDWSPDHNHDDYDICGVIEKNATSHPNIGLLKNAIEKEWNKMSEEFILKAWKLFRVNTLIVKNSYHIEDIYCFVSIFLFCCLFFKLKINLDL